MNDSSELSAYEVATALCRVGATTPIFLCITKEDKLSEEEMRRSKQLFFAIIITPFLKSDLNDAIKRVLSFHYVAEETEKLETLKKTE